jgi:putative restriction endonuclease
MALRPCAAPLHRNRLDFELGASTRHEYIAGEIVAMADVSAAHNQIVGNVYSAFRNHLPWRQSAKSSR